MASGDLALKAEPGGSRWTVAVRTDHRVVKDLAFEVATVRASAFTGKHVLWETRALTPCTRQLVGPDWLDHDVVATCRRVDAAPSRAAIADRTIE